MMDSERTRATATIAVFKQGDAAASALRDAAEAFSQPFHQREDLDVTEIQTQVSLGQARDVLPTLIEAVRAGCTVQIRAGESGSEVHIDLAATGRSRIPVFGDVADLAHELEDADLAAACSSGDVKRVLALLATSSVTVELTIEAPSVGAMWVRNAAQLAARLADGRWAWTLARIASRGGGAQTLVIVGDAGLAELRVGGLVIAGPDANFRTTALATRTVSTAYRQSPRRAGRRDIFEPGELTAEDSPEAFGSLSDALNGCAAITCWYWLASSVTVGQDDVTASFDGVRVVDLTLLPYSTADVAREVELAQWAMATAEPTRADTVQQAITFAVGTESDLPAAAKPALRTARGLYDLATRGVVSEALAARRASRDAAVTAARSAALTAREIASKAVERSLAVAVAAAVALFANAQKFLGWGVTVAIVGTLAVLLGVALTVALRVDVPSGRGVMDAFDTDVELYRDALSEDDVQSVKQLQALTSARTDLRRAQVTASWIYGGFAVLVVAAAITATGLGYAPNPSAPTTITTRPADPSQSSAVPPSAPSTGVSPPTAGVSSSPRR